MTIFWILAAGLAGLAVLFVVAPLLQAPKPAAEDTADADDPGADQARMNLALFKQQLAELDADLAAGKLDQRDYESARRDLERELLNDLGDRDPLTAAATEPRPALVGRRLPGPRLTALGLLFVIPISAWALYAMIGNQAIIPELERAAVAGGSGQPSTPDGMPPLDELVARLEQRLEQQPDDAEGWMMLGRTYFATGEREQAQEALARAYELTPSDPMIVLAYAESIATNNENQLEGRPAELISEALELDPDNATARWLAAMVAFQRGQFRSAATAWQKLLDGMDPESDDAIEIRSLIEEAERRAGVPPEARQIAQADTQGSAGAGAPVSESSGESSSTDGNGAPDEPAAAATPSAGSSERGSAGSVAQTAPSQPEAAPQDQVTDTAGDAAGLEVRARLDPRLAGRLPPSTTVFIFARAASGPPMPLAVQRTTLGQLPVTVQLDDSMAMMPAMKLSSFPQVIVGARVSPSGQAMPRPGDLEGETGPVSSGSDAPVEILIDRVRR